MYSHLLHYGARALLLFGFAFYIRHLSAANLIDRFVEPEMSVYVGWSAFGLLAMALYQAYLGIRTWLLPASVPSDCGCGEELPPFRVREALLYLWFALPLLAGLLLESA